MKPRGAYGLIILLITGSMLFLDALPGWSASFFNQVNADGFGNPHNTGGLERQTMAVFQDKLYVGAANRNDGAVVMAYDGKDWVQTAKNGFGNPANTAITNLFATEKKLYAGTSNKAGGEVWEYDGIHWRCLHKGPFRDFLSHLVMGVAYYKGRVYVGLWDQVTNKPIEVWAGTEPDTWERVSEPGFGDKENKAIPSMTISSADGTAKLYVAVWKNFEYRGSDSGCEIWSFDGQQWEKRNRGREGFGELNKGRPGMEPLSLFDFNKKLHVGLWDFGSGQPGELWSFDGKDWTKADKSLSTKMPSIYTMASCNNRLYAVASNAYGKFELWEAESGSWSKIVGENSSTPANFGNTDNFNISTMASYKGSLYLGVNNNQTGFKVFAGGGNAGSDMSAQGAVPIAYTVPELLYLEARASVYHVPVLFAVRDPDSDLNSVTFEYQQEGGPWRPATMYSQSGMLTTSKASGRTMNCLAKLPANRERNHYVCVWESEKDIGQVAGSYRLRATPADAKSTGAAIISKPVKVNNQSPPKDEMIFVPNGNFYIDKYEYPNHYGYYPLLRTTWEEACAECKTQGKELCTPEQWEAAYYGNKKLRFPYGPEGKVSGRDYCNTYGSLDSAAVPSGLYEHCVNDLGIYDMGGNVYEWASRSESDVFMADQSYLLTSMDAYIMVVEGKDHRHEFLGHRCCKPAEKAE